MIRKRFAAARGLACVALMAWAGATLSDDDQAARPLVTIDGFDVTTLHLALFASQTGRNPEQAEEQIRMLNELANNFMLANSAAGKALAQHPDVAAALEVARARLLAQAFVRDELDSVDVDEDAMRARYAEQYSGPPQREFKARHILLNSRDAAVAAIEALNDGSDFAELATQHSIGPSKSVGGDLGWFEADQMVAAFADATRQLGDGEYSREPVKTQFGWHVILREQSREVPTPEFDTVRAELESAIRQERVSELIQQIREDASIEVHQLGEGP
ncbi:MAG: peptidylprolyl isomerase [Gammaproteobacteria bacterium]|nr:peptidylprolyl isomerase [Gammaproteobacteria bacterium]